MLCGLASFVVPGMQEHLFDFDAYISNLYLRAWYPMCVCVCVCVCVCMCVCVCECLCLCVCVVIYSDL